MNLISKKNWYFGLSLVIIIPGLLSLLLWGLNLSIDFTGGSRISFITASPITTTEVKTINSAFTAQKVQIVSEGTSGQMITIRTKPLTETQHQEISKAVATKSGNTLKEESFETVGPVIGSETTTNAMKGIGLASILIVLYIAFAFRSVPKPASSWRFGICAIIALLHDALVVLGIFSILGHFFGVEVDSLFVTAILTVIGFSVHDTIVVFDRIRENLQKNLVDDFPTVVNNSLLQTLTRSLNTSFTVILVLLALLLFGGESIRWFIVALLIGIVSGTYSSIFNASALLVLWQEIRSKRR